VSQLLVDARQTRVVRLTITPIGAKGRTASAVAASVVGYLDSPSVDLGASLLAKQPPDHSFPVEYYADSVEGPGRWLGTGAEAFGLAGAVDPGEFQRVLEGRHPHTGERLITAQGSSQRKHLAVGTAAGYTDTGEALYALPDAALLLGLRLRDVTAMIDDGNLTATTTALGLTVTDSELERHLALAVRTVSASDVAAHGAPHDILTVQDAARLLRVSPQYVRRVCANFINDTAHDTTALACEVDPADQRGSYRIRREDLAAFAATREPPVARIGYDVTLTVEKSVAIATMLGPPDLQARFLQAFAVANTTAITHLERHAAGARHRGQHIDTTGLTVASYLHATSRALDPHPHQHNVVINAVTDTNGRPRALDARLLYQHAPTAAALAIAALRWELRDLNLGWWHRDGKTWELEGIAPTVIAEFSRRRNDIDEITAVLEQRLGRKVTYAETDTIALATRAPKQPTNPTELLGDWHERARHHGLEPHHLDIHLTRPGATIVHHRMPLPLVAKLHTDLNAPYGLCATTSVFRRADVIRAVADWATGPDGNQRKVILPPDEIERTADRYLTSSHVLQLHPARPTPEPIYTTRNLYELQADITSRYNTGRTARHATVPEPVLNRVLDAHRDLTDEQANLVRAWCTGGQQIQCAIGRAGTGKTTTMRAAVDAWTAAGYRVIGAAVKGEAARQLATDTGLPADTIALNLTHHAAGRPFLDQRTVLIIDEATTLGDRDLHHILTIAAETGATVRMIGDPAQHTSVPAGGSFAALCRHDPNRTPELTRVFRLANPDERHAAELIRDGHITQALAHMTATGQLRITPNQHHAYADILGRWYQSLQAGEPHPMIHGRNHTRRTLNTIAQSLLQQDGTVDSRGVVLHDGQRLCIGDRVIARHGNRKLHPDGHPDNWLRNGTQATITGLAADGQITLTVGGGLVVCPASFYDKPRGGLDLAYAVTSYAVQGSTTSVSTSAITPTTSRAEMYVDITRGRNRNIAIATEQTLPDDQPHLPNAEPDLEHRITATLERAKERTAYELDPQALSRTGGRPVAGGARDVKQRETEWQVPDRGT
jgi:conjugative relaxase-like TrwC/TraI family protein